jgi:hypothetical protein
MHNLRMSFSNQTGPIQVFPIFRNSYLRILSSVLIIAAGLALIPTLLIALLWPNGIHLILDNLMMYVSALTVVLILLTLRIISKSKSNVTTDHLHKNKEIIITQTSLLLTPSVIEEISSFSSTSTRSTFETNSENYLVLHFKDILAWKIITTYLGVDLPRRIIRYHEVQFNDRFGETTTRTIPRSPFRSLFNNTDELFSRAIADRLKERLTSEDHTGKGLF